MKRRQPSFATTWFGGLPVPVLYVIALGGVTLLAVIDDLTGVEISFSIFYLSAVLFMGWYGGPRHGYVLAVVAAATWLVIEKLGGQVYSHPLIGYWNAGVRLGFFALCVWLVGEIRILLAEQSFLAETDSLTQLKNTRSFYATLHSEVDRASRYRHPLTLAYLDLDNFKQVNDTWGHETGDRVLAIVAALLRDHLRLSDVTARLGGDEFVVLLPEIAAEDARRALDKIHGVLFAEMARNGWPVTASIGAVTFTEVGGDPERLIQAADELMYEVKRSGKNAVRHLCHPVAIPPEIG